MISVPDTLPDDPAALKQLLLALSEQVAVKDGQILQLREENTLLRQRLFGRKSEQTVDPTTPQLALFNGKRSINPICR